MACKVKYISCYQIKNADCFSAAGAVHTIEWIANLDWLTVPIGREKMLVRKSKLNVETQTFLSKIY